MIRRILVLLVVFLFGLVFLNLAVGYEELQSLRPLARHYVAEGPVELGAPNIVTTILITYRGFDTLGEVAVLFMVAASVGLLLKKNKSDRDIGDQPVSGRKAGEIVVTGAAVLMPFIFTFGSYVIVNGHLSAGGGFQGGAIVASGVMLLLLAWPESELNITILSIVESLAGVFYILIGITGIILAGGFLDGRFLPLGEFGSFISAGAIPLISALIGIKVGAELSVILSSFKN